MKSEWVTKWTLRMQMLGARHSVTGIAIWYIPFASSNYIKWLLVLCWVWENREPTLVHRGQKTVPIIKQINNNLVVQFGNIAAE